MKMKMWVFKSSKLESESANNSFQKFKIKIWKWQYHFSKMQNKNVKVLTSMFKIANLGSKNAKSKISEVQNQVIKVPL